MYTPRQGGTLFTAITALIATIVVIQLWLLAAALDALLSGHSGVLVPAALSSIVLLGVNAGILRYALGFDRRMREAEHDVRP